MTSPTGDQWVIGHGRQEAVVTEVGATLRSYTVEGRDVVEGFGPDEWSHGGHGQVLAPWPNRLGDGRYSFEGQDAQAALDEPDRHNAIHGLVRWMPWRVVAHAQNVVTLSCALRPTPGYPYCLDLRVEYRLGRGGLAVTTAAVNPGDRTAPFGIGFHPYLTTPRVDTAVLRLPARSRLVLDERALPTGEYQPVDGSVLDFTGGRVIGGARLDTAFTSLVRDDDGLAWAFLDDPVSGHGVAQWMDGQFGYLMCFTGDGVGRSAVALEPMSCPPDALRSGRDLVRLGPGESWRGAWGLQPR